MAQPALHAMRSVLRPLRAAAPRRGLATASLSAAQRRRVLEPAFWRARAARLEAEHWDAGDDDGPPPVRALCRDPHAALLAEALLPEAEREALGARADAEEQMLLAGVRAAFSDRFVGDAVGRRMRQVVLLGSGMDSHAFRLDVPPQLTFTEVDVGVVHDAKAAVLEAAGQRPRCRVNRVAVDVSGGGDDTKSKLCQELEPLAATSRRAGMLFILDAGFSTWASSAQLDILGAAASVAPDGSVIVGPAPASDAAGLLADAGFPRTNLVNHLQLSKIFSIAVPEGIAMMVAMRGPPERMAPPTPGRGAGGGREVDF